MIESREFDLDWEGRRCVIDQLGAKPSRQLARRVANILGTAIREIGANGSSANDGALDALAFGALLERLDDETIEWLTDSFGKVTRIEREAGTEEWLSPRDVADLVFGGGEGLNRWRRWMTFCLEMSCGAFFAGASADLTARQKAMQASRSPSTSSNRTSSIASQRAASTPTV